MIVGYIGFVECDKCNVFTQITNPKTLTIWYHPDDSKSISEYTCPKCGSLVSSRIDADDFANFRLRGCNIQPLNEKFEPLTVDMIDNWDIDAELKTL